MSLLDPTGDGLFAPLSSLDKPLGLDRRTTSSRDAQRATPRLNPRDMLDLLFRHRAKARLAAMPRVRVSLSVFTPSGRPAVQMSL
jgi:hypothetical protein